MLSADDQGTGPVLVLLHGFPLDRRIWTEAAAMLAEGFRVITVDLPGFGKSKAVGAFSMDSLATYVAEFLKSHSVDSMILGGLSMGGYVAQAFAARFPERLRGLILINTKSAADTAEAKKGRDQMVELVRARGSAAVAEQMYGKMITPLTMQKRPDIAQRVRAIMNECPPSTIEQACIAMRDRPDYTAALGTYSFPTLVVTGGEDSIATPAIAEQMYAGLRGGKLEIIPNAAHLSPLEQPAIFADAVKRVFLVQPARMRAACRLAEDAASMLAGYTKKIYFSAPSVTCVVAGCVAAIFFSCSNDNRIALATTNVLRP